MQSHLLDDTLRELEQNRIIARVWDHDPTVWGSRDGREIVDRLGWLTVAETMQPRIAEIQAFAQEIRKSGFTDIVLLGMGGSSLAPHVLAQNLSPAEGFPRFHMLDSTVPAAVLGCEKAINLARTLFVVASKSGSTIEMLSMFKYFWQRMSDIVPEPGDAFIAITDPGSGLERIARERAFRAVFLNPTDIGGRYSALSLFGLVPAALAGVDINRVLRSAQDMAARCSPAVPVRENPGAILGAFLGTMARQGRDKVALAISPQFADLGLWIEQLLAESTGKRGTGILPMPLPATGTLIGEALRLPDHTLITIAPDDDAARAQPAPTALVRQLTDAHDLGAEFYCWEMATAIAGHILQVNPFDQPNVAEAKRNTTAMLAHFERHGRLDLPDAQAPDDGRFAIRDDGDAHLLEHTLKAFFARVQRGHYVALLAYLPPCDTWDAFLADVQEHIALRLRAAVTVGYGPRYLHSTGQLHKGGPPTGHFIILTADDAQDVEIPGEPYTFSALKDAQALGDEQTLRSAGRPVVHIRLTGDVAGASQALRRAMIMALM